MDDHLKFDKIIPVGPKKFAYQCEGIHMDTCFRMVGNMPWNGGKEPYVNAEKDTVSGYELRIEKFTGNSFTVTLYKNKKVGKGRIGYQTTFDFASFVNQIFNNIEVAEFEE